VGGNVKGLVDKKRLYFPPRASNDARNFFAGVDVVGKYCDRGNRTYEIADCRGR
jgi:hypothetical protein